MRMLHRKVIGVAAGMCTLAAVVGAADPNAIPICVRAASWVKANRGKLPTTLPEISKYPMAYRKAIFVAQPVEVQKGLWREQLELFAGNGSPLNDSQRAFVRNVLPRLDFFFSGDEGKAAVTTLKPQIVATFGRELGQAVFAALGPADSASAVALKEPPIVYHASMVPLLGTSLYRSGLGKLRELRGRKLHPQCNCSVNDPWCSEFTCHYGANGACESSSYGCGTFIMWACDGTCY